MRDPWLHFDLDSLSAMSGSSKVREGLTGPKTDVEKSKYYVHHKDDKTPERSH